jgi:GTP-binding protein
MGPGPLPLRFVTSADRLDGLPASRAEVAFVGRSNVGKSSLLNALAGQHALAKVSKTPGRTRLLNCFALGTATPPSTVVDCPGYGYAAVSSSMRTSWAGMLETYLLQRDELQVVLALVDGEVGPTKLDVQLLEWLRANDRPVAVVATKHDKVRASHRERRKREVAEGCELAPADVVWVSAAKGTGIDRLRGLVRGWLAL